ITRLGFSVSEGQRYASGSLSAPLSASGITANLSYSFLSYQNIDSIGKAADLDGEAHYGSVGLAWQAVRTRNANLRFLGTLNGKVLTDDSAAGRLADKRIVSGTIGLF